jgi:adenylate kinase
LKKFMKRHVFTFCPISIFQKMLYLYWVDLDRILKYSYLNRGKGTQCERLAKEFEYTHLSTGDLLRAEVEKQSLIGIEADALMKEGKMVPISIIFDLLKAAIAENVDSSKGFLIDGFPRTFEQAVLFEEKIGPCRAVLYFKCSLEILEERLLERGKTSGRADDNLETIKKRFNTFQEQSMDVIEYYKAKGKCIEISSENTIDAVHADAQTFFINSACLNMDNVVFILGQKDAGLDIICKRLAEKFGFFHIDVDETLDFNDLQKAILDCKSIGRFVLVSGFPRNVLFYLN